MLRERIDDAAFLNLIGKWLKVGILDTDGKIIHPESGTPQGGIVSPVLANVYLHFGLDLWFEKRVKAHCKGAMRSSSGMPMTSYAHFATAMRPSGFTMNFPKD